MTIQERLLAAVGEQRGVGAADRLCEACVTLFEVDAVAISMVHAGTNTATLGASGSTARILDELQFTLGEGPCLDTVTHRAPVLVVDLADPAENRWPMYGPAMLTHQIRGVYAMPVVVAGQYIGALDLFKTDPTALTAAQLTGARIAAELAELPFLDLIADDLRAAVTNPHSDAWIELTTLSRTEVHQATGMLISQLDIPPTEALVRLRAHAYVTGRNITAVARDILERRLRLDPA